MKILYFSPHPYIWLNLSAGPGTHIREVIHAFKRMGHEVETLIGGDFFFGEQLPGGGGSAAQGGKSLVKSLIPGRIWESLKDYRRMRMDEQIGAALEKLIDEYQPDLIYERGAYLSDVGIQVARKKGVRHYLELNAPLLEERQEMEGKSFFSKSALKREKETVCGTARFVVVSSALKDYFMQKYPGLDPQKVVVTPNAINIEDVQVQDMKVEKLRSEYALRGKRVVGFVGSIFPYHGVDILIKAFAQSASQHEDIRLLIVGDGAILEELKQMTRDLGIEDRVVFTGRVPSQEIYNYIALMDITTLASTKWYCSPIKIFEYGALGKIVVAPNTGPVEEVMRDRQEGILIDPALGKLEEALNEVLNDFESHKALGERFREKVEKEHTWFRMATKILAKS